MRRGAAELLVRKEQMMTNADLIVFLLLVLAGMTLVSLARPAWWVLCWLARRGRR